MPIKVYLELLLLVPIGIGLVVCLVQSFRGALRAGQFAKAARSAGLLAAIFLLSGFFSLLLTPCSGFFGKAVCAGPSGPARQVALTFDDGPNEPYTSQILDVLQEQQVPATFFLVGKNLERNPAVVRRLLAEGHFVGNHSWDHQSLLWKSRQGIEQELEDWEKAMTPFGLPSLKLFRAPHGWKSPWLPSVLREKGYRLIGWGRGVWDSDQPGTELLLQRLTRSPVSGEIILLHDGAEDRQGVDRRQTVELLPRLIAFYRERGFRFVTLQELLGGS